MEINQLKTFVALARNRSFSKTAQFLHVGQSTISMRISALETALGRKLFERNNKEVLVTSAGLRLLPFAERILELESAGIQKVQSMEKYEMHIGIGTTESLLRHLLLPLIVKFHIQNPRISISIQTGHSWEICEKLLNGSIQLGFVYQPINHSEIQAIPFYKDKLILVSKREEEEYFKIFLKDKDSMQKLPLVNLQGDPQLKEWMQKYLPTDFISSIQVDQISTVIDLIKTGYYIGFVPNQMVEQEIKKKVLCKIKFPQETKLKIRKSYLIFKSAQETEVSRIIEGWLQLLKDYGFNPFRS